MNFYFITTFLKKVTVEVKENYDCRYSLIANVIMQFLNDTPNKSLKDIIAKKKPLQYIINLYQNSSMKEEYIKQATQIITDSYSHLGKYNHYPYICAINDEYYFYSHRSIPQEEQYFGCVIHKGTDKSIYDFECSYEEYQTGKYVQELALTIFLLSKEFKNCE